MEDNLGIVLFHGITLQRDMLYPATLREQQVCSWRQGEDALVRGGSNRWWHTTMLNTYRRLILKIRVKQRLTNTSSKPQIWTLQS